MAKVVLDNPLLRLHERDNVAVALQALEAEADFSVDGLSVRTVKPVDVMHKVALRLIGSGQNIIKYGHIIGVASCVIEPGELVHSHNCVMTATEKNYDFCSRAQQTEYVTAAEQAHFMGYRRTDGRVGTRNYIGIITTVNCSATVASAIATKITASGILAEFPNVTGVVALTHTDGCGMRADGEGYELLERTLTGYIHHPNFGGVLVIGLGCETMQLQRLLTDNNLHTDKTLQTLNIQTCGGTKASIEAGQQILRKMLPHVNESRRSVTPASELIVALQCGGSDGFSGISANPALGVAADLVVRQGGTVIYSETPEIFGAEHLLTQRAVSPQVAEQVLERIEWWKAYTKKHGFELDNNPSPGNRTGGLTTIIEKSLGAQAKSGSTELKAVYLYAEPITEKGLVFMDSPGFDPVSVTGQVASGANLICFTTGRGSAFGFKPVPSVKLASNNALFMQMCDDIDVNCGGVITGESTLASAGQTIFEEILAVASGKLSKSEELDYGNNEFNPWKLGATL